VSARRGQGSVAVGAIDYSREQDQRSEGEKRRMPTVSLLVEMAKCL
jgi:hypothetical protein